MSGKRKRKGHGPAGKSVALTVHEGVARQLDELRAEQARLVERNHRLEGLIIAVVIKAGGILDVDNLPPNRDYGLQGQDRDGGMVLIVTDSEAPEGQGGNDADEDHGPKHDALCSG